MGLLKNNIHQRNALVLVSLRYQGVLKSLVNLVIYSIHILLPKNGLWVLADSPWIWPHFAFLGQTSFSGISEDTPEDASLKSRCTWCEEKSWERASEVNAEASVLRPSLDSILGHVRGGLLSTCAYLWGEWTAPDSQFNLNRHLLSPEARMNCPHYCSLFWWIHNRRMTLCSLRSYVKIGVANENLTLIWSRYKVHSNWLMEMCPL